MCLKLIQPESYDTPHKRPLILLLRNLFSCASQAIQ